MAVTRLKRKILKKKIQACQRKVVFKHLTAKPILKKTQATIVEQHTVEAK